MNIPIWLFLLTVLLCLAMGYGFSKYIDWAVGQARRRHE